ncbi:hypothetical protein [Nonomuraea diastatica]|nr:hypothetical protein [Nonomuraea diastatica]
MLGAASTVDPAFAVLTSLGGANRRQWTWPRTSMAATTVSG